MQEWEMPAVEGLRCVIQRSGGGGPFMVWCFSDNRRLRESVGNRSTLEEAKALTAAFMEENRGWVRPL